jgi:hypothetical protein
MSFAIPLARTLLQKFLKAERRAQIAITEGFDGVDGDIPYDILRTYCPALNFCFAKVVSAPTVTATWVVRASKQLIVGVSRHPLKVPSLGHVTHTLYLDRISLRPHTQTTGNTPNSSSISPYSSTSTSSWRSARSSRHKKGQINP